MQVIVFMNLRELSHTYPFTLFHTCCQKTQRAQWTLLCRYPPAWPPSLWSDSLWGATCGMNRALRGKQSIKAKSSRSSLQCSKAVTADHACRSLISTVIVILHVWPHATHRPTQGRVSKANTLLRSNHYMTTWRSQTEASVWGETL